MEFDVEVELDGHGWLVARGSVIPGYTAAGAQFQGTGEGASGASDLSMVERRPGIWPAERELLELDRARLEEEEREGGGGDGVKGFGGWIRT